MTDQAISEQGISSRTAADQASAEQASADEGVATLDRASVVAMLAAFGDRAPEAVDDVVGSLELTWLIAEVEQRYSVVLDLTDEQLAGIRTVADATAVLGDVVRETLAAGPARGPEPGSN